MAIEFDARVVRIAAFTEGESLKGVAVLGIEDLLEVADGLAELPRRALVEAERVQLSDLKGASKNRLLSSR